MLESPLPDVKILLLGSPRVLYAGKPFIIKRRKALALLAYLAVTQRRHTREALAAFLWPDTDAARAHAYLRNAIWILKKSPVGKFLEADYEGVELRPGVDLWVDVSVFFDEVEAAAKRSKAAGEMPATRAHCEKAAELYGDHFLAGFGLGDNFAFDEWLLFQEEKCRAALIRILKFLISIHEKQNQIDRAIDYAVRLLSLDFFNESVLRRLMALYALLGRRGAALNLFEKSERLFKKEMGMSLSAETTALRDKIVFENNRIKTDSGRDRILTTNFIESPTPFLGREMELKKLHELFAMPQVRLLTLVGSGGVGKTRLATKVAGEIAGKFIDGVHFVPLAAVDSKEFLVPSILKALGAPFYHRSEAKLKKAGLTTDHWKSLLYNFLREKQMLLVLDNLEQLVGSVDVIAGIIRQAPGVKVLGTSRERLHLQGEWVMDLQGLPYPEPGTEPSQYEVYSAVQLFVQTANRMGVEFSPAPEDLAAVAGVCRRLQGSPLGIELAATWVRTLTCHEIAEELDSNFDFLVSRHENIPDRHRSLRNVFEQSWRILAKNEQTCFRRLSVFHGTFAREAAEKISGCSILTLRSLIDKSLLLPAGHEQYQIHEVLRQYAGEKLESDAGEHRATIDRYTRFYLNKLVEAGVKLKGPEQKEYLEALAREGGNIRVAWLHAAKDGLFALMTKAFLGIFLFYDIQNRYQEGADISGESLELINKRSRSTQRTLFGLLLASQGWFNKFLDPNRSRDLIERSLNCFKAPNSNTHVAFVTILAVILGRWLTLEEIQKELLKSLSIFEAEDDRWGMALSLEVLSFSLRTVDPRRALNYARQSLRLRRQIRDHWGVALSLFILGWAAEERKMYYVAGRRFQESLGIRDKLGVDPDGAVSCLASQGYVTRQTGRFIEALQIFERCLQRSRKTGNRLRIMRMLAQIAVIHYELDDFPRARLCLNEALPIAETLGTESWMGILRSLYANIFIFEGDLGEAHSHLQQVATSQPFEADDRDQTVFLVPDRELQPKNPWGHLAMARLAFREQRYQESRSSLKRAIHLSLEDRETPTWLECLVEIANIEIEKGVPDKDNRESAEKILEMVRHHPVLSPLGRRLGERNAIRPAMSEPILESVRDADKELLELSARLLCGD
ncbi:MAG: tetratricopeptide repeat protein [Candidatus Eisenbacteria bacterium]|uniref:Tetratricopeptide repeat protein n=1 Tax=Eiseniibacteriota bacterium TaxID=2212470 RepID=A0A948RWG4_UNCEI|nr:tetratricopeptide repeat protein [Candidatus Eisenbacteria bacterium]MBU2690797.1 tetratricopeptide repeat protein [Candidatus Eisenbacteria bacterium]